ncbi:unnamed protein product [Nezara viridula]|uniref:Uncharacterized protein n=1 Tax=Nezara viridula TaxID=85310 RepID=A0A9P0EGI0_NEZVI|nr:unnamed protein product [Nezara viridula]
MIMSRKFLRCNTYRHEQPLSMQIVSRSMKFNGSRNTLTN